MQTLTNANTGTVYNYVERVHYTETAARTVVDFGVKDQKGRAVGMSRYASHVVIELRDGPKESGSRLHEVGKPTDYFEARGLSTRNGEGFGSALVRVEAGTLEAALAELDARIERARKSAVRKFAA